MSLINNDVTLKIYDNSDDSLLITYHIIYAQYDDILKNINEKESNVLIKCCDENKLSSHIQNIIQVLNKKHYVFCHIEYVNISDKCSKKIINNLSNLNKKISIDYYRLSETHILSNNSYYFVHLNILEITDMLFHNLPNSIKNISFKKKLLKKDNTNKLKIIKIPYNIINFVMNDINMNERIIKKKSNLISTSMFIKPRFYNFF
jgi:hypothetical protein